MFFAFFKNTPLKLSSIYSRQRDHLILKNQLWLVVAWALNASLAVDACDNLIKVYSV